MNGFLWVGVVCTVILAIAVVVDGLDSSFDALDLGPSWLSLPVLAAFLAAFGFGTGALVDPLGPAAAIPGLAAGAGMAALVVRFTRAAEHMRTDPTDAAADLLGSIGRIVTPPAAGRYGEVLLRRPAGPVKVACIAVAALPSGTEVVVVDVTSSTLVTVEAFDPLDDAAPPQLAP